MKTTFLFVFLSLITLCNAQVTHVWTGNSSSRANAWDCPENWSTHVIPGPHARVLVPENPSNANSYPVISNPGCMVNTLQIEPGARITIAYGGSLTILNPDYCNDVSRIKVFGKLELPGTSVERQEPLLTHFRSF